MIGTKGGEMKRDFFIIMYLVLAVGALLISAYFYWYAVDISKATFWLLMSIACDVSIIRREASQ